MNSVSSRGIQFSITKGVYDLGVHHPVVALFKGVKQFSIGAPVPAYVPIVKSLMDRVETIQREKLKTPEVHGFRELYSSLGHKKLIPAGERLLSTCIKKGTFPQYGNLVDAYNIVVLENVAGIGVHDAAAILNLENPKLVLRRADGTEEIIPAFSKSEKAELILKGDLTYGLETANGFEPFAWLGKKDVDSKSHQLREETTSFLLTAIGHMYTSEEMNRDLCNRTFELIKMTCPDATMEIFKATVLDEAL